MIIGMADSSHLQKWVNQLSDQEIFRKIYIFPSDSPKSKFKKQYPTRKTKIARFHLGIGPYLGWGTFKFLDLAVGLKWRSLMLYCFLKAVRPSVIHFHEIQHGAYLYNSIANKFVKYEKIITSTWGSDILLYGKISAHTESLRKVLSWTDVLTSERSDDLAVALELGFKGQFVAPIYITIGADSNEHSNYIPPSKRKGIIIKGYQGLTGRALNALYAVEALAEPLHDYEIFIYSTEKSPEVVIQSDLLVHTYGLKITCLPKMPHRELMEYFKKSRIYVGLSISDGLSTSMVEAMMNGAYPIQSENSAASEFIHNGLSGESIDPWDLTRLVAVMRNALEDDARIDQAALINYSTINQKYNLDIGIKKMLELYTVDSW